MTLQDIKNGLAKILGEKTSIKHITDEDVSQSYDSVEENEFLHIQLIPLRSSIAGAGYFLEKEILVDIAYMEKLHTSNNRLMEVLDMLDGAFKPYFWIKDRAFYPDAQMDITDDIAHYKMYLKFTDSVPFTEEELAEGLRMDWRI